MSEENENGIYILPFAQEECKPKRVERKFGGKLKSNRKFSSVIGAQSFHTFAYSAVVHVEGKGLNDEGRHDVIITLKSGKKIKTNLTTEDAIALHNYIIEGTKDKFGLADIVKAFLYPIYYITTLPPSTAVMVMIIVWGVIGFFIQGSFQ